MSERPKLKSGERVVARAQPWAALQAEISAMMTGRDMLTLHLSGEPGAHFWGWSANGPSGGPSDRVSIAIGPCRGATVADLIAATREALGALNGRAGSGSEVAGAATGTSSPTTETP
jgi:hypothetical protein